jgi:hypothetical protein
VPREQRQSVFSAATFTHDLDSIVSLKDLLQLMSADE